MDLLSQAPNGVVVVGVDLDLSRREFDGDLHLGVVGGEMWGACGREVDVCAV